MTVELKHPYSLPLSTIIKHTQTDPKNGLKASVIHDHQTKWGQNILPDKGNVSWLQILLRQFKSAFIGLLIGAAVLSWVLGEVVDSLTILLIVFLNGLLGFVQEWKSESALENLKKQLALTCRVVRDGQDQTISVSDVVVGDVVVLNQGEFSPADLRVMESLNAQFDEAALTGESAPVLKEIEPVSDETPLAERHSMAWMGTPLVNGHLKGIVTAVGPQTEFGKIAELTSSIDQSETPLQQKLHALSKTILFGAIGICLLLFGLGLLKGNSVTAMLLASVSLAVAIIPEGLPAVVTITLALGIKALVKKKALLRHLQAAESLGCASVICSDKTGTLTKNEMTATTLLLSDDHEVRISGSGYQSQGDFLDGSGPISVDAFPVLTQCLTAGLICNHAQVQDTSGELEVVGDPTEAALVVAAQKAGISPVYTLSHEISFTSSRKRMSVIAQLEGEKSPICYVKGAPSVILERCQASADHTLAAIPFTDADRENWTHKTVQLAKQGLRTLGIAYKPLTTDSTSDEDTLETDLIFLGIVGIQDPPREDVSEAIRRTEEAGISLVIITGDAPETAMSIAQQIGVSPSQALTGNELEALSDAQLSDLLKETPLFARTTPEQKYRIVSCLQDHGHVVAMTGDGINDAPALKKAQVGIAMGIRGTEVAKGAADVVLTDDNYASIISAIREGRRQYDNIRKFVTYLLSSNVGEVIAITLNIIIGGPLLLLPAQILWINLITDGVTAVSLGLEPPEKAVMKRPPLSQSSPILTSKSLGLIGVLGTYLGLVCFGLYTWAMAKSGGDYAYANTIAFTSLVIAEKCNVFNFRSLSAPIWKVPFFSNPWLLVAWVSMFLLQIGVIYLPFFQHIFHTVPLGLSDWGVIFGVSVPIVVVAQLMKAKQTYSTTSS